MKADFSIAATTDGILHYGSPSHGESSGLVGAGAAGTAPTRLPLCSHPAPAAVLPCRGKGCAVALLAPALHLAAVPVCSPLQTLCKPSANPLRAPVSAPAGPAVQPARRVLCAGVCFLPPATEPE